jgi:predicted nucleic acid-binding protein
MAVKKRTARARPKARTPSRRYTIDASVFVNAFNRHEKGHAQSLQILSAIRERGDPVIVPVLIVPDIASAVARATDDTAGALQYAHAAAALPHLTVVSLTATVARQAAALAANHRLRGADAIYVTVARRYGTTLVSRDAEQRIRGAEAVACQTPEEALEDS